MIGPPVLRTSAPRRRPSVGAIATARTLLPPRCWAVSAITTFFSPMREKSISSAKRIGHAVRGNSTSSTGPATLMIRPTYFASAIASSDPGALEFFDRSSRLCQRFRSSDDLGDLRGDVGRRARLADMVSARMRPSALSVAASIARRRRNARRRMLPAACEDCCLDEPWQQAIQDLGR